MSKPYVPITEFQPEWISDSEQSLRYFIRKNEQQLLESRAVVRLGDRIGINPERFWRTVEDLQKVGVK